MSNVEIKSLIDTRTISLSFLEYPRDGFEISFLVIERLTIHRACRLHHDSTFKREKSQPGLTQFEAGIMAEPQSEWPASLCRASCRPILSHEAMRP